MSYEDISVSWEAFLLSVAHAAILAVASLSYAFAPVQNSQNSAIILGIILALTLLASVLVYLKTGIPNVIQHECQECGHKVNGGRLRCSSCGEPAGIEYLVPQVLWFVVGYSPMHVFFFVFLDAGLQILPIYRGYLGIFAVLTILIEYVLVNLFWVFLIVTSYVVRKAYGAVQTKEA
jgi:hypothetical protein